MQTEQYDIVQNSKHYHIQHGHLIHSSLITNLSSYLPHHLSAGIYNWLSIQRKHHTVIGNASQYIQNQLDKNGDIRIISHFSNLKNQGIYHILGHTHTLRNMTDIGYINPGKFCLPEPKFISINESGYQIKTL
jgi:predicted phosphodiesterase